MPGDKEFIKTRLIQNRFTPGVKKVIEFLKESFRKSITDVEDNITF